MGGATRRFEMTQGRVYGKGRGTAMPGGCL